MLFDSNTTSYTDKVSSSSLSSTLADAFAGVRVPEFVDVDEAKVPRQPPCCNTVVDRTSCLVGSFVDWVGLTDPSGSGRDVVLPWLSGDGWVRADRGMHGYRVQHVHGHVRALTDGTAAMGDHYEVSGQGCRELEAGGLEDWPAALREWRALGGGFSRLDVAFDDRAGVLPAISELVHWFRERWVVTHYQRVRIEESFSLGALDEAAGVTLTIGSSSSPAKIRIYDKTAERASAGEVDLVEWGDKPHVIRVELQCRDEQADMMARLIASSADIGQVFAGVLLGKVDFKDPSGGDSNRSRWPTAAFWLSFLGNVEKTSLAIAPAVRSIEDVKAWVEFQVGTSLTLLMRAAEGDASWFYDLVKRSERRLRARHWAMLEAFFFGQRAAAAVPSG